jgi:HD superfamily phosphohydrolase
MLKDYPTLTSLVERLDEYLARTYPEFFGSQPVHPVLPLKSCKFIHDNLWGTNRFSWLELALIDSPLLQRLRGIHQTGLAYYVYPSARHSRFEHSLGVTTIASRAFDALLQRSTDLSDIASTFDKENPSRFLARARQELRLAALLHDTGHSIHSHTSEIVYSKLPLLAEAASELTNLAGRRKGTGEVLSFCLSRTKAVAGLLSRAVNSVADGKERTAGAEIDMDNVSLLIIGRSKHPYLQFLADIISSDLDADKLDYLLRDASFAGLPLRYDIDRYLYTVGVAPDFLLDGEGHLGRLYAGLKSPPIRRKPTDKVGFPHYDTYRLRLPLQAMSTIEQIVICKFMLYSYIYHHAKVRAAEGLLAKMLSRASEHWRQSGSDDVDILYRFLEMTDSAMDGADLRKSGDPEVSYYCEKVRARLLPREVLGFVSSMFSHAQGEMLANFISILLDPARRGDAIKEFEKALGEELLNIDSRLGASPSEAIWRAGAWLDVPSPPKFENIHLLIGHPNKSQPFSEVFPIEYWIQAYESHRYEVRIFAFSEYFEITKRAARSACKRVIGISSDAFYDAAQKVRSSV